MTAIQKIRVGMASCGRAAGAEAVLEALRQKAGNIPIEEVGCIGHCYAEPLVELKTDEGPILYRQVTAKDIDAILAKDKTKRLLVNEKRKAIELHKVTRLAGHIDPVSLEDYLEEGGFEAFQKALTMTPRAVVEEVKASGLRGRGGGGFSTGLKWSFLAAQEQEQKILICNADEGDPGAFMDRSLMESVTFQVLEGMLIAAHATGATKAFIYCRAEYPLAILNLKKAIAILEEKKLTDLAGRTLEIVIKEGAGAFVCGEETAMIASLEGKRGTPRFRPPFPTDAGWQGHPTLINNVETFANVPLILQEGAERFSSVGTENSKGTKLFALAGDLPNPGLVEVPMGTTIGEIVFDIGGADPEEVKAVQTGGPSGGCIPVELFHTPVDYDSLSSLGAIMGSGGLIVIGRNRCMVDTARYFLDFTHRESCGKCTFCRVGTKRMFEALERITGGSGSAEDVAFLESMGPKVKAGSLCGLGQTAPNPVLSTLRYYRNEYDAHVNDSQCPALVCPDLVDVYLDKKDCVECKLCIKTCPVDCVSDDFVIDNDRCTRCNSCIEVCPKDTIYRTPKGATPSHV